jgi:hypothetical protein
MITVISKGLYQVTTSGGATVGEIDGDYVVGFQTRAADGHKLGAFPTLDEALKALIAPDRTESQRARMATHEHP